jgi:MFS family permease
MADATAPVHYESRQNLKTIIAGSSAGTLIEWYDFYIFGSLSTIVSSKFFPSTGGGDLLPYLKTLLAFWIGFAVRPFGAIFFGYMGDIIGRKYTFLLTLIIMGGATFAIGLMPSHEFFDKAGVGGLAPVLLVVLRVLQGLALGGEYGGAATYIAEHCPDGQRGFWTSWIQTTATLGLFVSLGVILTCRLSMSDTDFNNWGWRIPFLLSIVLVIFSYILRMRMKESPLFIRMKASGKSSKNPFAESFLNWYNLKFVLIALFGATAGQGVVWYTGQFYALTFLQKTMNIEFAQSNVLIGAGLLIATPFFIVMGRLSDRIGRKPIILTGCLLAVITYVPIFHGLWNQGDISRKTLVSEASAAQVQVGEAKVEKIAGEDKVRGVVAGDTVTTTKYTKTYTDGTKTTLTKTEIAYADATKRAKVTNVESNVKLGSTPMIMTILLIALLVFYVTMVYGPIAAFLVEMFPTRIRYSSMSLPYHIGNGVFGGLVPLAATWVAAIAVKDAATKDGAGVFTKALNPILAPVADAFGGAKYAGLIYPITIAAITFVIGLIFIREKKNVKMLNEH